MYADNPAQRLVPKLTTLTLSRLDFLHGVVDDTLDFLRGRRKRKIGLKLFVIQLCRVHRTDDDTLGLAKLVKETRWIDAEVMGSDYEGSDNALDSDEFDLLAAQYGNMPLYGYVDSD